MNIDKKKILIIGSSAKEYALVRKLQEYGSEVVVAPGNSMIKEITECVDIRESNVKELLEYVLENAIDFTIACSLQSIKADIASLFNLNGQMIFAPSLKSADVLISRALTKKMLYRLKVPSPKFAVYDKLQNAVEYLKTAYFPQVISAEKPFDGQDRLVCATFTEAKTFVEDLFFKGEEKVVLEDYVYGHEFTIYFVTDGYHVLPLNTVANYKFLRDCDGGLLTSGIGAFSPDYKVSSNIENDVLSNVVNNFLQILVKKETPYIGILGVDAVLQEDGKYFVLGFKHFLSDHDADVVLSLVDENLLELFSACAVGSFADDYTGLKISDNASVSCVLSASQKGKVISGLDLIDSTFTPFAISKNKYLEYETIEGKNIVISNTAKTLSRARKNLYDDIDVITYDGKKYRKDICELKISEGLL